VSPVLAAQETPKGVAPRSQRDRQESLLTIRAKQLTFHARLGPQQPGNPSPARRRTNPAGDQRTPNRLHRARRHSHVTQLHLIGSTYACDEHKPFLAAHPTFSAASM